MHRSTMHLTLIYRRMNEKRISYWKGLALISSLGLAALLGIYFYRGGRDLTEETIGASIFLGLIIVISTLASLKEVMCPEFSGHEIL